MSEKARQKEEKRQLGAQEGEETHTRPGGRGWGELKRLLASRGFEEGAWIYDARETGGLWGVAESILAWVSLDGGRVLLSALVSSLAVGIMSLVSSPKTIRTLRRNPIPSVNTLYT